MCCCKYVINIIIIINEIYRAQTLQVQQMRQVSCYMIIVMTAIYQPVLEITEPKLFIFVKMWVALKRAGCCVGC